MYIKILTFLFLAGTFWGLPQKGLAMPLINDSFVESLECRNLSTQEIYQSIRPTSFSSAYHLPLKNWSFSVGLYDLAACWSLARSQRLFFYLARWNQHSGKNPSQVTFETLEQLRGSSPYAHVSDSEIKDFPLQEHHILAQQENTWNVTSPLWLSLTNGITQRFPNDQELKRNLRTEIEYYQRRRFHDFLRNIRYIIGDGSRSQEKNLATRNQILRSLENNRLPLLLLRPKRVSQHVVLAKAFEIQPNGDIKILVYDSNTPFKDQVIVFKKSEADFYAPEIIKGLPQVDDPQAALGVYVVDEGDHRIIEKTLLKYYQSKCGSDEQRPL